MNIEQKNSIEEQIKEYRLWIFQLNQKYGVGNFININKFSQAEYQISVKGIIRKFSPKEFELNFLLPLVKAGFLIPFNDTKKGFVVITKPDEHKKNVTQMIENMKRNKYELEIAIKELEKNLIYCNEILNFYGKEQNDNS